MAENAGLLRFGQSSSQPMNQSHFSELSSPHSPVIMSTTLETPCWPVRVVRHETAMIWRTYATNAAIGDPRDPHDRISAILESIIGAATGETDRMLLTINTA